MTTSRFRLSTGNVNAGFRTTAAYRNAIPGMVRKFNQARSSVRFINEAGDRDDATRLCDAFGDDWRYNRAAGRDSRLSSAIMWDTTKHRLLEGDRFDINDDVTHDSAAWGLFRTVNTGVYWFGVTALMWPFPIGSNVGATRDNNIRRVSIRAMLRQARAKANDAAQDIGVAHIPVIAGGDMNHPVNEKPDVIGEGFAAYNLADTDKVAQKRINGWATTKARSGGLHRGARIDRIAIDKTGVVCHEQETIDGYPPLDHNPVVVSLSVTNEK